MTQFFMTTPIKLGQCARCEGYVFTSTMGGLKVAADPEVLDVERYREALVAGRPVYRLLESSGRPWKLETGTGYFPAPGKPLVAAHGCGAHAMDAPKVQEVVQGPQRPSATSGGLLGGSRPPHALAGSQAATQALSHATPATHPRSSPWTHPCDRCCQPVRSDDPLHVSAQYGDEIMWALHLECEWP